MELNESNISNSSNDTTNTSITPVNKKPYGSVKKRHGASRLFQEKKEEIAEQRVERKHWNKAMALLNAPLETEDIYCFKNDRSARRIFASSPSLVQEIRRALLRHDWISVSRLYQCYLDVGDNNSAITNKLMIAQLLSNPASNSQLFKDFCCMALGMKGKEIDIFLQTICKLPKEIPRGYIKIRKHKLIVKNKGGDIAPATSYLNATLQEKTDEGDADD
ncbi:hypothetical protein FOCC_FOCC000748 [Frankliniella occidentalis]|uniref:Uncharacterized protein LOC113204161 n=1 Tax=Frankliniella occidentalis TaxID=133901 RepID=A0A6J1S8E5_FRAOC|nr:uncharacterized protein LOC113204161 [Frankliniella occidentalis]KAE8752626.1 hypothetical protein FOCC_FOCC000748 [Frankliniella occidentalis]